jgi:hypothetical protein
VWRSCLSEEDHPIQTFFLYGTDKILDHVQLMAVDPTGEHQEEHLKSRSSGDIAAEYIGRAHTLPYSAASQHVQWHRPIIWTIRGRLRQSCVRLILNLRDEFADTSTFRIIHF